MKQSILEEIGLKIRVWLLVCMIGCLLLNACGSVEKETETEGILMQQDTLQLSPDFSYVAEVQLPWIRIDKEGYLPEGKKTAFFIGNDLEEKFLVIKEEDHSVVFEGTLTLADEKHSDTRQLYSGDFSKLTEAGSYIIYQQQLGCSYPFEIGEDVYYNISAYLKKEIREYSFTTMDSFCSVMANMMLTSEIYGKGRSEQLFLKRKMTELINSQDQKTGAFAMQFPNTEEEKQISLSATAEAAGVLAQYSFLFGEDDLQFKVQCLQASAKAYSYIAKYRDTINADIWYYAAAQLYRANGGYQYRQAILEYDTVNKNNQVSEYDYTLLADMAYLSTTYKTDFVRCNTIMTNYLSKAQEISLKSSREHFYVYEDVDHRSEKELLQDMMVLGVVNYVLSGREYCTIQENYIHYFLGINDQAKNRLTEEYSNQYGEDPLEENITKVSQFLFILGNLSNQ